MNVFEEIKKIIVSKTDKQIELTSNLRDLGIDSLELLDFIVETENLFNIQIDDNELLNLYTIDDVVKAIETKLK